MNELAEDQLILACRYFSGSPLRTRLTLGVRVHGALLLEGVKEVALSETELSLNGEQEGEDPGGLYCSAR